ncbi:hypothetical protein V6N12_069691 [Hibiscus sabdariffa]|uniref:Uncharacterized protein n=1 Tax=Hibiscus sabdariffa TaxID=183260 RepID=A0ABR2FEQ0_9ROSI
MFRNVDPRYEEVSEGKEWDHGKRMHREKEIDATITLATLYENETKSRKVEKAEHHQSYSPRISKELGLEAPKRNYHHMMSFKDMSEIALLHTL